MQAISTAMYHKNAQIQSHPVMPFQAAQIPMFHAVPEALMLAPELHRSDATMEPRQVLQREGNQCLACEPLRQDHQCYLLHGLIETVNTNRISRLACCRATAVRK